VAARELVSEAEAKRLIGSLRDEAGADEILLIAGDRATPAGPFADSAALLRTGLFARHGILRLGLAAYPEGNPKFDAAQWRDSFRDKAALAQDQGIALTLVTQFAFDGAAILAWLDALRTSGVGAPVRIGMAGPAKLSTLIKFGVRCGVGNSLRFLTSRPGHLANLLGAQGPDDVLAAIARADTALSVDGPHFFSFGGFAHTARWIARVRNGDFTLSGRDGLHVPAG
jgi:methylenetetrahydrofolate reductase (NADPH)